MSQQQQQQQLLKTLEDLLKLPENRDCADCGTKAPRWSSTNLGIFVCIRCSGIHRAMGTHISKVKSVSLDKWTPEQVEFMQKMGNGKAKEIYEANVDGYQKGDIRSDNIALEQWIRDKYEHKRFMRRDYDPRQNAPAHHNHNHHHSSHSSHSNNSSSHSNNSSSSQPTTRPRQASNPTPVSRPPAQPKSLPPVSAPAPLAAPQAKPVGDLLDWDAPVAAPAPANPAPTAAAPAANTNNSNNVFGDFGDFVSATPSQPALPAAPAPVDKNSILQLYNTPIAPQAAFNPYGVPQQQMHQYPGPNYNITGLGVPGAMHPGMMGMPHPGMGMNPGMGMGGVPQMGMGMPPGMGMNPGMGAQGMMPGMGVPGMTPGYPGMGGVPQYYGIPNQQLGMRPTGVPNQTF